MVFKSNLSKVGLSGFTLFELVIVVGILGVLLVMALANLNPIGQMNKARDTRRKGDLNKMQVAFEDYYSDHNCYPTPYPTSVSQCRNSFLPYLNKIPCDPNGKNYDQYAYPGDSATCPQTYAIYTILANKVDPDILAVGCQNGCGPTGNTVYNYGVWSSNIVLENSQRLPLSTAGGQIPALPPPVSTATTAPVPTLAGGATSTPGGGTPTPLVSPSPTPSSVPAAPTATSTPVTPTSTTGPTPAYACVNFACVTWSPPRCAPARPVYDLSQHGLCVNQCPTPANQCY